MNNSKKLGLYISFKYSEKELYDKVKSISNYSTVIKNLLQQHIENGEYTKLNQNEKSMLVTIDDLCRIISSVNPVLRETRIKETYNNEIDTNQNNGCIFEEDLIPEDMLNGL